MKKFASIALMLTISLSLIIGCGSKSKQGSVSGFASPQALVDHLKGKKHGDFSDLMTVLAPDEFSLVAFSLDFAASFMSKFSSDKKMKEEYAAILKKFKLEDMSSQKPNVKMQDPNSVIAFANERYGKIDARGFVTAMEGMVQKFQPDKKEKKVEPISYINLKDVKIDGDKATGTVEMSNKKSENLAFRKIDGKWYLSMKDQVLSK